MGPSAITTRPSKYSSLPLASIVDEMDVKLLSDETDPESAPEAGPLPDDVMQPQNRCSDVIQRAPSLVDNAEKRNEYWTSTFRPI
jgi:hypothetical protein